MVYLISTRHMVNEPLPPGDEDPPEGEDGED